MVGGDTPPNDDQWTVTELAEAIREVDSTHLMTAHSGPGQSAVEAFGELPWLRVNTVVQLRQEPFRPPAGGVSPGAGAAVRPHRNGVRDTHDSRPEQIRRQAYWAMLSGACGQFFGNNPIWHFDVPGLVPTSLTWQQSLDGTGSRDMGRLGVLFRTRPWNRFVPEDNHRVVVDGYGSGTATVLTAITPDRAMSVAYIPSTGTKARKRSTVEPGAIPQTDQRAVDQSDKRSIDLCSRT